MGKDATVLTTSKFTVLFIFLIAAMLLSGFRTLEEYGPYSQLLMAANLVGTLFMLGLPNSINFFFARAADLEEKQKKLNVHYTLSTILCLLVGLILVLLVPVFVNYFKIWLLIDLYIFQQY